MTFEEKLSEKDLSDGYTMTFDDQEIVMKIFNETSIDKEQVKKAIAECTVIDEWSKDGEVTKQHIWIDKERLLKELNL